MKKRLFASLLALLMLLPLLAAAPAVGATEELNACPQCGHAMVHYDRKYATCTEGGWLAYDACLSCGYSTKKEIRPMFHDMDNYTSDGNNKTHTRRCKREGCNTTDTQECTNIAGKRPTCVTPGPCSICGGDFLGGHTYFGGYDFNPSEHWLECIYCNDIQKMSSHSFEEYQTSEATCVSPAVYDRKCSVCDYSTIVTSGDKNPDNHDLEHHDGKAPTCTEKGWAAYDTCQREGCNYTSYKEIPALDHDRIHHDAQAPTCTEIGWEAYDTCSRCNYTTYVELPASPDNHALRHIKAKPSTCTDRGWEAYDVCKRCGYNTIKELPALSHWYGEWTPNGSHTHLASCKRGCGQRTDTTCAALDYALLIGEDTCEFTLCPVCGEVSDGSQLRLIELTTAQPITRWLPAGEEVLRLGTLENGEILLTAAFEISGQLTQPTGQVQFTLPAEHLEGFTLTILHPDGTEEPLPYTTADKTATFTLDFTDQETPAMTLRLTPET